MLTPMVSPNERAAGSLVERVEREAGPLDLIVVAGSIFLVGEAKGVLARLPAVPVGQ